MNYTLEQISNIPGAKIIGDKSLVINNIAYDSRIIYSAKNTAFIAINTEKNSGEKYIEEAVSKGIQIIISEKTDDRFPEVSWITVDNSVEFLQKLAKFHGENSGLKTIGITGSNGKTIVKEWLYQCVSGDLKTVKSPKSFNSQIGLPLSLLQIKEDHILGIFEVGISKPYEMETLADIFSPQIGLLTHIGNAHLANFVSEEELIDEKLKLFKKSETVIFNGDNDLVFNKINKIFSHKKLISFGLKDRNNVRIISDIENDSLISVKHFEEIIAFPAQKRDEATLTNVLAVISVLKLLDFDNEKIIEKINQLKSVEMRLESIEGSRNNLIINDSFNLDLDSLKTALQSLKEYRKRKKSIVLTDIIDVNADKNALYNEVSELVNEQKFETVFLVGDEIAEFHNSFISETYCFDDTKQLIESKHLREIENQIILLKGARKFEIEKVKDFLELRKHDTVLEVNLNAILHNINFHKSLLKAGTKMMAMVKANAYGLGSYEISEFLQHHHIDYLGVAYADEGVDLRKKGITVPIIVMNPEQHSYEAIIEYNLEPEIYSLRVLELFTEVLEKTGYSETYPIHIKLETGMNRLGFKKDDLQSLLECLHGKNLTVKSIFSHLSSADVSEEKEYTLQQLKTFQENSDFLLNNLEEKPLRHILNSSGIGNYSDYQFDMVRIGIGMLGESSNKDIQKKLQSTVTFKTVISQISNINKGDSVGYSRKFKADKNTKIATIPVGYADGIPRLIGNAVGKVGIKKHLAPIVGNVCMDMIMIDITEIPGVKEGDTVTVFNSNPTLKQFAEYCQTITYEVLTSISPRVKRIYIKD
ncbi:alanine racemase [Chryseobacterium sp. Leaf180]|uniref:bifunctional UDP-N-acetylmuramoyl-tripeptide:D-alanyl-D-alanine ligase/alanine racemase n=1 Tax=Chryseobacterium sp. Leaf180 TaxID=1736289 RepID=UPI0006F9B626|nr:bifunctional UDP-N-acetylmuramoyl-tripeptide:D-alanyl-D-alanine ligase/alanine racemase [Chryseobacterium sp. Leaf180]KQR95232.1 alanine racemase [Chryseobacterium sp. Leaf180]